MELATSLAHLPFFEHLAHVEENSPEWYSAQAGLVTLRLVDRCLSGERDATHSWTVRAVRVAVSRVPEVDSVRSILSGMVDAVETCSDRSALAQTLLPRLMAFGRALDHRSHWTLASDVYRTIGTHANAVHDADLAIDASLRLGYCARVQGSWEVALDAYLEAGRLAELVGDVTRSLRARISNAALARERGNYPQAERILDGVIASCGQLSHDPVRALALHERASVAFMRRDFERGVQFAYDAYENTDSPRERDRILSDIASFFLELGVRSAARDAFLLVAATAQEQWSRWAATVNLMELSAIERVEPQFESYRRELGALDLPPRLGAHYQLFAGRGLLAFGRRAEGLSALQRALSLAEAHGLNDLIFQIEGSINDEVAAPAPRKPVSNAATTRSWSPEVEEIARSIGDLRLAAGL